MSIDFLAHDCNGPLIYARIVPALDGGEIRLARLIALASHPAMTFEVVGRGCQRIDLGVEIDTAVAVAIHPVELDVLGHELSVSDFAMHGAACRWRKRALRDERKCCIELIGEEL